MKNLAWIVALFAGLAGVGVGSILFVSGRSASDETRAQMAKLEEQQAKKEAEFRQTIADLTAKLAALDVPRFDSGPAPQPAAVPPMRGEIPAPGAATFGERRPIPDSDFAPQTGQPTPQFRAMVQKVVADQKAEEEAKARQQAEQRRIERVGRQVDRSAQELQLNDYQKDEMKKILVESEQNRSFLVEKFRNPDAVEDPELVAQAWRDLRDTRNDKLKGVLTPDQMDKFSQSEGRRFNFGGFGGGGPGGGGGGGFGAGQSRPGQTQGQQGGQQGDNAPPPARRPRQQGGNN